MGRRKKRGILEKKRGKPAAGAKIAQMSRSRGSWRKRIPKSDSAPRDLSGGGVSGPSVLGFARFLFFCSIPIFCSTPIFLYFWEALGRNF